MTYEKIIIDGKYHGVQAVSAKRRRRRALCETHGITTGRQWVRLRKALQRQE